MFERIDHVGIAVDDLAAALTLYRDLFGLTAYHDEASEEQGTHAIFLRAETGADIELLEPLGPETPVGKFLAKRGPGIHHICYVVPDLEAAIARCLAEGLEMVDQVPRTGLKGKRVAFIHPKAVGGVLIELYEDKAR